MNVWNIDFWWFFNVVDILETDDGGDVIWFFFGKSTLDFFFLKVKYLEILKYWY